MHCREVRHAVDTRQFGMTVAEVNGWREVSARIKSGEKKGRSSEELWTAQSEHFVNLKSIFITKCNTAVLSYNKPVVVTK